MTAFLGGKQLHGKWIYARGLSAASLIPQSEGLEPGFFIRHYGRNDVLQRVFDTSAQFPQILQVDWQETERGPSEATLLIPRELAGAFVDYDRIDIHPFRDPDPWWSGYAVRCPDARSERWPAEVKFRGWYTYLDRVRITDTWQSMQVSSIVDDLARDIELRSRIVYSSSKIQATNYVVNDFRPVRQKASETLNDLATLAGGFDWGVDERRRLWFRAQDTSERYWKWLGPHVQDVEIHTDTTDLVNVLHIKSGKVQGTGQDTYVGYHGADQPHPVWGYSQVNYGVREDEETAPSILDNDDALRWGEKRLDQIAWPKQFVAIDDIRLAVGERVEARGTIRLHLRDGTSVLLPIKRVAYTMNSREVRAAIDIGEIRRDMFGAAREFWTDLERQKLLNDQTLKQVS